LTTLDKSKIYQLKTFGQKLRELRGKEKLLLRQVAAAVEMDTALLSKIERGERMPNREQVLTFATFFKVKADDLVVAWLSDKLASEVQNEHVGLKAIKIAEKKIKFNNKG